MHCDVVVGALIVVCSELFVASVFVIIVVSRVAVVRKVEVAVSSVCREIVVSFEVSVTSTVGIIVVSRVPVGWVGLVAVAVIVVVFKFAVASVDVIIVVLMGVVEVVLEVSCFIEVVCKS